MRLAPADFSPVLRSIFPPSLEVGVFQWIDFSLAFLFLVSSLLPLIPCPVHNDAHANEFPLLPIPVFPLNYVFLIDAS